MNEANVCDVSLLLRDPGAYAEMVRESGRLGRVMVFLGAVTLDASIEAAKGVYPDLALQGRANDAAAAPFAPADVVVANILGPLLIAFADEIAGYAKRTLVVSGILDELYPEVLAAFAARGFREISHKAVGEWTTGCLRRA